MVLVVGQTKLPYILISSTMGHSSQWMVRVQEVPCNKVATTVG